MVYGGLPRSYGVCKPAPDRTELDELLKKAKAAYDALSQKEKDKHDKAQRDSWIKGEMTLGMD